ncbi:MAG: FixH family protein [Alphaproteobacteria bacterium]|nr:FixH family protein [Alphaproteobacteria bacterium]
MTRLFPLLILVACGEKESDDSSAEDTATYEVLSEMVVGDYLVRWSPTPDPLPFNDYFSVDVEVLAAGDASTPMSGLTVDIDAQMPAHGHGMTVDPVTTDNGDGTYTADPMLFHMEGYWQIIVDVGDEQAVFNYTCCE